MTLTAIDLFAGGGGLTVGLKHAGFCVVGAVEIERHAFSTYKVNHPEVVAFRQDVRTIRGEDLKNLSSTGNVDLLVGCPPCQGFSSLTSKYRRHDPRNDLVLEMKRRVEEIQPKVVMMENVPGLSRKGHALFEAFLDSLRRLGYLFRHDVLQVADYGVPQSRRRLVLLAGRGFQVEFPHPTHARVSTTDQLPWLTVRSVLRNLPPPVTLQESQKQGGPQGFNWHVVRSLHPRNAERLKHSQPGKNWSGIPRQLRPSCHQNEDTGFTNVYGRMSWDQVAPTITGGCTTFSKGRFGHPEENRTISVREAALFQTFPPDYVIDTPFMEHACNIVGNAFPCEFAAVLAQQCVDALKKAT